MDALHIRLARTDDLKQFAPRAADRDELWAIARRTPEQAIRLGIDGADAFTVFLHGECAGIFGCVPSPVACGVGAPWGVFSDVITRYPLPFLRASRRAVASWHDSFYALHNLVDARNVFAVRWLQWLGFTIAPAQPFGPDGLPFHLFSWRQSQARHV